MVLLRKQMLALLIILNSSLLFAGGFQINEHGARAMAMGGAFTAIAFDPSAVYFNSAALVNSTGIQMMLGTTLIAPAASFRGPYGPQTAYPTVQESKVKSNLFFPSHAFVTYKYSNDLAFGFGFSNPFGLGTEWDKDWVGRFAALKADVKTFSLNPVVSYRVFNGFSIGAGLQYNIGTVTITKNSLIAATATAPLGEAFVEMSGEDFSALGYTFSVLFQPNSTFSVGANYRSESEYNFEGSAKFTPLGTISKLPYSEKDIKATLVTPQQFTFGLGYRLTNDLLLAADFQYIYWSSYDSLKVDFVDATMTDQVSPRLYKDTWIFRVGADYKYSETLSLQCGLLYDKNPVQDHLLEPSLPDADRLGYSVGASYKLSDNLTADFSYLFLSFKERTISNSEVVSYGNEYNGVYTKEHLNGTYNFHAHLASVSFKYNF